MLMMGFVVVVVYTPCPSIMCLLSHSIIRQQLVLDTDSSQSNNSTALMRTMAISSDDTVGVAVQQSDLPMIQFLLNGEPQHELAINRFRGSVYPSICLMENDSSVKATLVLDESQFKELSPHARFGPLIVARGII